MEIASSGEALVDSQKSSIVKESKSVKRDLTRPTLSSSRRNADAPVSSSNKTRAPTAKFSSVNVDASASKRRNTTGGLGERQPVAALPKRLDGASSFSSKVSESPKTPNSVSRRSSLPGASLKTLTPEVKKVTKSVSRLSVTPESSKKATVKPSLPHPATKSISTSPGSNDSMKTRARTGIPSSKASSRSVSNGVKVGSGEKRFLSGQEKEKSMLQENLDSHSGLLPQVEIKSSDDLVRNSNLSLPAVDV